MNQPIQEYNDGKGPVVLRFTARLVRADKVGRSATGVRLELPAVVSEKLGGLSKVEGTINGHPFRAALETGAAGGQALPVNAAMLKGAGADAGDTVQLAILGPEPEPVVPTDLEAAMATSPGATALWNDLTDLGQRDYLRWIEAAKKPETRARRVTRTVEQLAEGKRRACCVNVNEYMLCRIEEAEQGSE